MVIVEGDDDRRAIFPFLSGPVVVVPAGGKTNVLAAYQQLEIKFRAGVVFIVDCDGSLAEPMKGRVDLVITTNRDIEADLLLELKAFDRVADEYLSPEATDPAELANLSIELLDIAADLAHHIGVLQASAAGLGLRTRRLGKAKNGGKIRVFDLPSAEAMASGSPRDLDALATDLAALTGWSPVEREAVIELAEQHLQEECAHSAQCCSDCRRQRHANGHHLVDCVTATLANHSSTDIAASEVAHALRIGADRSLVSGWEVAKRLQRWQDERGLVLLST